MSGAEVWPCCSPHSTGHNSITRVAHEPGAPREGAKQEQVLAMLRRPGGATVVQIAEATGWAQNTVRGFFAASRRGPT